jgi:hypothetical protein
MFVKYSKNSLSLSFLGNPLFLSTVSAAQYGMLPA